MKMIFFRDYSQAKSWVIQKSMSLKSEPASEPLRVSAKLWFLDKNYHTFLMLMLALTLLGQVL